MLFRGKQVIFFHNRLAYVVPHVPPFPSLTPQSSSFLAPAPTTAAGTQFLTAATHPQLRQQEEQDARGWLLGGRDCDINRYLFKADNVLRGCRRGRGSWRRSGGPPGRGRRCRVSRYGQVRTPRTTIAVKTIIEPIKHPKKLSRHAFISLQNPSLKPCTRYSPHTGCGANRTVFRSGSRCFRTSSLTPLTSTAVGSSGQRARGWCCST